MEYWITQIYDKRNDETMHYVYPSDTREGAAADTRKLFDYPAFEVRETLPYKGGLWPNTTPEGAQ